VSDQAQRPLPTWDRPGVRPRRREATGPAPRTREAGDAPASSGLLAGRKVLIIVENLPVPFDRRVWQEACALRDAGAEVSVICPTGKGCETRHEVLDRVWVYRHPQVEARGGALGYLREYGQALFWELRLALKVLRERGFDAIHACNPPDLIFLVALPFKLIGKRFVFDHHDINPELYEAKFGRRGLFWRLLLVAERLTFALADISIATNDSYRAIALERGKMRPGRVFVVRSGPDLTRVKPAPPNPKWRNGRRFLVGYLGVLGEQEGIDLLLLAASELKRRGRDDIQFCIAGGGPALEHLKSECARQALADRVEFTGRIPDAELFEMLSTADICVNSDRVNPMNDKSTMNKVIEYMALGKPIVQFDVTEGRVSAAGASLYAKPNDPVDMADQIERLVADADLRERMGRVGRRRVEQRLAWSHQAPEVVRAYRELFDAHQGNTRFS
jgi:glycosyltransferase involved in cell wall biosynthesis